ncbi:GNAT family N-acetyltransferase [Vibrio sp. Of7-15]|uniref:GNAT family N-acetyltransferase n=1 Tax=Vibrio sp. Of7-15 TaxID=2724879 RepID=UPI001EF1F3B2|nr:GNAT family N-acetyltransferase [Vibrio sp. Of7-15]MCG7495332.1 GNAT family N-acetyltransferase [Vibrio sp. Of7-15]
MRNHYQAALSSDYFISDVEVMWSNLEKKSETSFFLSWSWIGTWLTSFNIRPMLLEIKDDKERIVGLGFLTKKAFRYKFLTLERLYLNRTGDPEMDQVWIEYNDVLVESGLEDEVRSFVFHYLESDFNIDEIMIGVSDSSIFSKINKKLFHEKVFSESYSYQVSLNSDLQTVEDFLSLLSRNTRYQIHRSIKKFEENYGQLKIDLAVGVKEKKEYLSELKLLHKNRWDRTQTSSGFNNEKFNIFHENLLGNNETDLFKVTSGEKVIGYLYCFRYSGKSLFYLSGIEEFSDSKLKPGLVMHCLAIVYYSKLGIIEYDFLAGDYQYKKSLSNKNKKMSLRIIRKKNIKTEVISKLESIKGYMERRCTEV